MRQWIAAGVCALVALTVVVLTACAASPASAPAETTPARAAGPRTEPTRTVVSETEVEVLDTISFLSGSATLHPRSTPLLDAMASTLAGNPSIKLVAVRAYGADALAQFQAQVGADRAQVIVDQLVARGVARERLVPNGAATPPPGVSPEVSFEILERTP